MAGDYPSLSFCAGKGSKLDRADLQQLLRALQVWFFNQTGVVTPLILLRDDEYLDERTCRLEVDDSPPITFEGLGMNEFWLQLQPSEIADTMRFGRRWQVRENVLGGTSLGSIVVGDESARQLWQDGGYRALSPVGYLVFATFGVLQRVAAELLVPALVEYYLIKLNERVPVLVSLVRQRFNIEELTLALRSKLLASGSIKNLSGTLERLIAEPVVLA